jgi:hypothetical protein
MSKITDMDYRRLQHALASAEYRCCKETREKLACLLFSFSIRRKLVAAELQLSERKVRRFDEMKGNLREKRGRPGILKPHEERALKEDLRKKAAEGLPMTRPELIERVQI